MDGRNLRPATRCSSDRFTATTVSMPIRWDVERWREKIRRYRIKVRDAKQRPLVTGDDHLRRDLVLKSHADQPYLEDNLGHVVWLLEVILAIASKLILT
jgi:hypothetical protein